MHVKFSQQFNLKALVPPFPGVGIKHLAGGGCPAVRDVSLAVAVKMCLNLAKLQASKNST